MKAKYATLVAALLNGGLLTATLSAHAMPELKFSGFGTLGAVHSSEKHADYISSTYQPTGAGATDSWSTTVDSLLGVQADVVFNDKWSAVVQMISKYHHDRSYWPQVEWANIKYKMTDQLSVRVGRIALPAYALSETRQVAYTNLWVRPPVEAYGIYTITSSQGVDATYRSSFGEANNTVQMFYGTSVGKAPWGRFESNPGIGINDTIETGAWTLRAAYTYLSLDMSIPFMNSFFAGLNAFAAVPGPVGAEAQALALKYKTDAMRMSTLSLGATYDPGQWIMTGEYVDYHSSGILPDARAWYVSGGYRFGTVTPYASYSRIKQKINVEAGIPSPMAATLNAGLRASGAAFSTNQSSVAVGMRWDLARNVALKTQIDRVETVQGRASRFSARTGFVAGGHATVTSVSLDFVF